MMNLLGSQTSSIMGTSSCKYKSDNQNPEIGHLQKEKIHYEKLREYRERVEILNQEFGTLETTLQEKDNEIDRLQQQVGSLSLFKQKYLEACVERQSLLSQLRLLQAQQEKRNYENEEGFAERINHTIRVNQQHKHELQEQIDKLRATVVQLDHRNKSLQNTVTQNETLFKDKLTTFRDKWDYMKKELLETTEENDRLKLAMDETQASLSFWQQENEQLRKECHELRRKNAAMIDSWNQRAQEERHIRTKAQDDLLQLDYHLVQAHQQVNTKDTLIDKQNSEIQSLQHRNRCLTERCQSVLNKVNGLQNSLSLAETEISRLDQIIKRERCEKGFLEAALGDSQRRSTEMERKIEGLQKELGCWKESRMRFDRMRLEVSSRSTKEMELIDRALKASTVWSKTPNRRSDLS